MGALAQVYRMRHGRSIVNNDFLRRDPAFGSTLSDKRQLPGKQISAKLVVTRTSIGEVPFRNRSLSRLTSFEKLAVHTAKVPSHFFSRSTGPKDRTNVDLSLRSNTGKGFLLLRGTLPMEVKILLQDISNTEGTSNIGLLARKRYTPGFKYDIPGIPVFTRSENNLP